jgi:hypothetical protein
MPMDMEKVMIILKSQVSFPLILRSHIHLDFTQSFHLNN